MAKKRRTAKQLKSDRRLGRLAKARAKKKRGGRRKVAKRKTARRTVAKRKVRRRANPKRTALKKSHLYLVFKCRGKTVHFLGLKTGALTGWKHHKAHAILFKSKSEATKVARAETKKRGMASWHIGVGSVDLTSASIAARCRLGGRTGK